MAKAPKVKPGGYEAAGKRQARAAEVYRVTAGDLSFTYAPYNLPIRVRAMVRDTYGMSVEQWLFGRGDADVQTYADVWWLSRLAAGEDVTRDEVHAEWDERCPGLRKSDITDERVADGEADPEA